MKNKSNIHFKSLLIKMTGHSEKDKSNPSNITMLINKIKSGKQILLPDHPELSDREKREKGTTRFLEEDLEVFDTAKKFQLKRIPEKKITKSEEQDVRALIDLIKISQKILNSGFEDIYLYGDLYFKVTFGDGAIVPGDNNEPIKYPNLYIVEKFLEAEMKNYIKSSIDSTKAMIDIFTYQIRNQGGMEPYLQLTESEVTNLEKETLPALENKIRLLQNLLKEYE